MPTANPTASPRLGWWLAAIVLGMIAIQFLAGRMNAAKQRAGIERNDMVLKEDDLPGEIEHWNRALFTPAKAEEQLAEDQIVWTHSWSFQQDALSAHVAFDQAGFMHWHDLTVCYQGLGWTMTTKSVQSDTDELDRWPVCVAHFKKPDGSEAMLVFSLFFDNGDPVDPRGYEVANSAEEGLRRLLGARFARDMRTSKVASIRQCQVFVPYSGRLTPEIEDSIVNLHLQSREAFRNKWLEHWHTVAENSANTHQPPSGSLGS